MRRRFMLVHVWLALLTGLGLPAIASWAHADWPACGFDLAPLQGRQAHPAVVSDMAGGVFIAWDDARSLARGQVHIQRLNANGQVAQGWPANGTLLCASDSNQFFPEIDSDGMAGAFAIWYEPRDGNYGLFAQRITAAGGIAPGWPNDGVKVTAGPTGQTGAKVRGDGHGGAMVTWCDNRNGTLQVYLQRLTAQGEVAPGWPDLGLAVHPAPGGQFDPTIISDGVGGAVIAWADQSAGGSDIVVQRITSLGSLAPGWPEDGVRLGVQSQQYQPRVVSDEVQGVIVAWAQYGLAPSVYAQRLTASGSVAVGWPTTGIPLSTNAVNPWLSDLVSDGSGGAIAAWTDYRNGESDAYAQRVDASGGLRWPIDGVLASPSAGNHDMPRATPDGLGGVVLVWTNNGTVIRAQRVLGEGVVAPGWGDGAVLCATETDVQQAPVLASVCGGVVAVWVRNFAPPLSVDVMAQAVSLDGTVGVTESDGQPPTLTVTLSPSVLFPPNHQMVTIHATVETRDDCDGQPTVALNSITSSEPDEGLGGGDSAEDIQGAAFGEADFEFQLRSERTGGGAGRTYTVCYTATDGSGNSAQQCSEVKVPRTRGGHAVLTEAAQQLRLVILGDPAVPAGTVDPSSVLLGTDVFDRFSPSSVTLVDDDADGMQDLAATFAPESGVGSATYAYWRAGQESFLASLKGTTDVPDQPGREGRLAWVSPNPGKGAAVLHFRMGEASRVKVTILDITGRVIGTPVDAWRSIGEHRVPLGAQLPAEGIYLYRVEMPSGVTTGKFVFLE